MHIHIAKNGNPIGPFTEEQTRSMVSAGMVSYEDLAWTQGVADWRPLRSILGDSNPPPIPASAVPREPAIVPSVTSSAPKAEIDGTVASAVVPQVVSSTPKAEVEETAAASIVLPVTHSTSKAEVDGTAASTVPSVVSSGPKGVGGWLVFFCVGLVILTPLRSFIEMDIAWKQLEPVFREFPSSKTALIWETFGVGVLVIYGFVVGSYIWSGDPQGRSFAQRFLLIRLFGLIAVELIALLMMGGLPKEAMTGGIEGAVTTLFGEAVYFTVWWSYFKKSKRVRNTYGDERA